MNLALIFREFLRGIPHIIEVFPHSLGQFSLINKMIICFNRTIVTTTTSGRSVDLKPGEINISGQLILEKSRDIK